MVKSKYVSVTQMCNDKSNDDLLREAIENFCKETPGSREWERAFTTLWSLILECKILATSSHPEYADLLLKIQFECSQRICNESEQIFEQIEKEKKSLVHGLRLWINWYGLRLRYRILDLYREDKKKRVEISLDELIDSTGNEPNIPTIEEVDDGKFPDSMKLLIQSGFYEKLSEKLSAVIQEKLLAPIQKSDCHPKKYPQCTCGEIAKRRLLRNPPQRWEEIADELKVPQGTVASHWHRKCKPLLIEIYNELLGGQ